MNYSFVVIDKQNKLNINEFTAYISGLMLQDYDIIYCSTKEVEHDNIRNYVFDTTAQPEQILNTTIKKCEHDNIFVIRDVDDYKSISDLLKKHKKSDQIVYLEKKQSKFKYNLLCFLFFY